MLLIKMASMVSRALLIGLLVLALAACEDQLAGVVTPPPVSGTPSTKIYFTADASTIIAPYIAYYDLADSSVKPVVGASSILTAPPGTSSMAYVNIDFLVSEARVRDLLTGNEVTIATSDGEWQVVLGSAAIDRSGSRVSYALENTLGSSCSLFVADGDGSNARLISDKFASGTTPAFSPDGSLIAYYTTLVPNSPSGGFEIAATSGTTIETVIEPTEMQVEVDGYASIDWSRDGRRVLFNGSTYLYYWDLPDGKLFVLDEGMTGSWSPDGKKVVYAKRDGNQTDLYVVDVTMPPSTGSPLIQDYLVWDLYPSWSPDGKWIVYSSYDDQGSHRATLNLLSISDPINSTTIYGDAFAGYWLPR